MNTTTIRAALARARAVLSLIDWQEALDIAAHGLRILWAAAQLLLTSLVLLTAIAYEHRARIRAALVTAIARTYVAGVITRRAIHALSTRSAALLPRQPLPAVAPITASLAAAREALELLVRRLYPVAA
jgi:hypothetical protein